MVEKRPIIYYQNLMHHYDHEVAALMQAKQAYILLSDASELREQAKVDEQNMLARSQQDQKSVEISILEPQKPVKVKHDRTLHTGKGHHQSTDKAPAISGLGLNLDQIFGEEEAVANRDASQYFKD